MAKVPQDNSQVGLRLLAALIARKHRVALAEKSVHDLKTIDVGIRRPLNDIDSTRRAGSE